MSAVTDPAQMQKPNIETVLDEKSVQVLDMTATSSQAPSIHNGAPTSSRTSTDPYPDPSTQAGPIKIPFLHPLPNCTPQPAPALTPEQQQKYNDLLATVSSWTQIPTTFARNAKTEPIAQQERMWLTRDCLLRYLRATKWSPTEAPKRLLATLTWRREYGVNTFTPEYISPENETGKQVILGYDFEGRPCLYLNPSKQNTQKSDRQLHHLVFMLERVIDLMGPGQETSALLINFKESSSGSNPSVGQGKQTLVILQGHYPERLGRALISELPWYVTTFFKLISPFIDPVTKSKMKFNEPLPNHVPSQQLQRAYGGDADFVYDHSVYWPALAKLCEHRRELYRMRWEKAGSQIGEIEAYLRGGDVKCLSGEFVGSEVTA